MVASLRQLWGLKHIYCWHGLAAYWSGVATGQPPLHQYCLLATASHNNQCAVAASNMLPVARSATESPNMWLHCIPLTINAGLLPQTCCSWPGVQQSRPIGGCMRAQVDSGETIVRSFYPFGCLIAKTDVLLIQLSQHMVPRGAAGPSVTANTLYKFPIKNPRKVF